MSHSWTCSTPGTPATEAAEEDYIPPVKQKEKTAETAAAKIKGHLRLVENKAAAPTETPDPEAVHQMLDLLKTDMTDADLQYMKQAVIPALPIVMGSVPFHSVFPQGADGQISYKGFDVSPKLQELIEKGYRTGQPVRVELDKASAVVLKFRNGQVSAEFMSTDKQVAMQMKHELDDLRHRMSLRNLPVGTLEYREQPRQQQSQKDDDDQK